MDEIAARIWNELLRAVTEDWWVKVLVPIILVAIGFVIRPVRHAILAVVRRLHEMWKASGRIDRAQQYRPGGLRSRMGRI